MRRQVLYDKNNSRNENLISFCFFFRYPKRNDGRLFSDIQRNEKKRFCFVSGYPETSGNCPKIEERKSRFHYLCLTVTNSQNSLQTCGPLLFFRLNSCKKRKIFQLICSAIHFFLGRFNWLRYSGLTSFQLSLNVQ